MAKSLYIAEKPSVAYEFAKALKEPMRRFDGYMESDSYVVTWCVGHLVTMSYPDAYDPSYKRWSLQTLPFLPKQFKYEVIDGVKKQFETVKALLNRGDVACIYVCTDSGREGEYIYRLVEQMAKVKGKKRLRVWIDSQTEEEILKGIENAKDLSAYDNLSASAYLRAKEDYLMGINFSRLLTLKYGPMITNFLGSDRTVLSIGRVMTCVLGMVTHREREIRNFVKTPFYRVLALIQVGEKSFEAEWRAVKGSKYFESPFLYKENGFKQKEKAQELIDALRHPEPVTAILFSKEKKKEKKAPPLLFNLAELQNSCAKLYKCSPDETLNIAQELYEKKLITYPRTDARVLSTAVSKEIVKNLSGLRQIPGYQTFVGEILENHTYEGLAKTKYVNDKQITDHYAMIPTGQGIQNLASLSKRSAMVYDLITRRFLSIFYPPAVYEKIGLELLIKEEYFFANFRFLLEEGYLKVGGLKEGPEKEDGNAKNLALEDLNPLKKGQSLPVSDLYWKEGETTPPKRYTSGAMILAMENAGQLIEDEDLRAQIKGSGIGTSATRAEILKKLVHIKYLSLNQKTQVITPTLLGEMVYEVVDSSIRHLLNPDLTASWEKGLTYVAQGTITPDEYMEKLEGFIDRRTTYVKGLRNQDLLRDGFLKTSAYYKKEKKTGGKE